MNEKKWMQLATSYLKSFLFASSASSLIVVKGQITPLVNQNTKDGI